MCGGSQTCHGNQSVQTLCGYVQSVCTTRAGSEKETLHGSVLWTMLLLLLLLLVVAADRAARGGD